MEKIGLITKLLAQEELNWETYQQKETSPEAQKHTENLAKTLNLLKEVKASQDLGIALGVEQLLLNQELSLYVNSPEETNSVKKAIEQIQDARQSLEIVKSPKEYQAATQTYSSKRKEAGLPIDSFREFLKSHTTRLTNRMSAPLSVPEKNILRQRKEMLGMVKTVYMDMQRKALGIEAPEKSKGLGL